MTYNRLVSRLASKASQLIGNFTTNLAENWMNIRAKFDGGKMFNRSQAGSWEFRCMGAGLQLNLGSAWGPKAFSEMTQSEINPIYQDVANKYAKKIACDKKRKSTEKAKEQRRRSKYSNNDNSAHAQKAYRQFGSILEPDEVIECVSPETIATLKESFYNSKVKVTEEEAIRISKETLGQGQSEKWMQERKKRITASVAGGIIKMRAKTKRSKKVKGLLYSKFKGNEATRYGIEMEQTARMEYLEHQNSNGHSDLKTKNVDLIVSVETPWLAASPDGRVNDSTAHPPLGLVEFKNPYSFREMTLLQACQSKKPFCLEKEEKEGNITFSLKRRHDYFFQVQCQMYCENREWCDFVLHTEKELHIERIAREKEWWANQMPRLKSFYFEALLPELACTCNIAREPYLTEH